MRLKVNDPKEDQDQEIGPLSIFYVQAATEHSFFDISEDLILRAFFGPKKVS